MTCVACSYCLICNMGSHYNQTLGCHIELTIRVLFQRVTPYADFMILRCLRTQHQALMSDFSEQICLDIVI